MIGLNAALGIVLAMSAPPTDPRKAMPAIGRAVERAGGTLRREVTELTVVPQMEPTLLVARICTGLAPGMPTKSAGGWIRPPPPTTASTHPAVRPAAAIRT